MEKATELQEELAQIEKWENTQKNELIKKVDIYCENFQKARQLTIKYIEALEKIGLEVENFSIMEVK